MSASIKGYVFRSGHYLVNAMDVSNQVTKSQLVPDQPAQVLRTMVPDGAIADVDNATWTWELSAIQDFTTTTGIAAILSDHAGEHIDVVHTPKLGGPSWAFTVIAAAVPSGGEQGSWNTFDATLQVVGQPVRSTTEGS
jgi:hypothetical protein